MFRLIKMDLHRLVHSTSTWVTMAFVVMLAVFCVCMTNSDIENMKNKPQPVETEERGIGIYVSADPEWATGKMEAGSIISTEMRSGLLALLCVIFTALFCNAEQKNGFIKNIAGQFPKRGQLVASRFVVIAVHVLVMVLVFSACTVATGLLLWGSRMYMGSVASLFAFLGTQYLLHLGFVALIMFFSILTRSTAFSMTAGILVCTGLLVPIYSIINNVVNGVRPGWSFDINQYMLDGNITMIGLDAVSDVLLRGAVVGLAFAAAAVICSMLVIKKRDI